MKISYNHSCISVEEIVVGGAKDLLYVHIHTTVSGPTESWECSAGGNMPALPVIGSNNMSSH